MDKMREAFQAWANREGYDTANTHDGIKLIWLNPMTADLWKAYSAAIEHVGGIQQQEPAAWAKRSIITGQINGVSLTEDTELKSQTLEPLYLRPVPAPALPVKTWQERSGFTRSATPMNEAEEAMCAEIADLRAALAAINKG